MEYSVLLIIMYGCMIEIPTYIIRYLVEYNISDDSQLYDNIRSTQNS